MINQRKIAMRKTPRVAPTMTSGQAIKSIIRAMNGSWIDSEAKAFGSVFMG
jgi:hypothetical protein